MATRKLFRNSIWSVSALAGLAMIVSFGGCPVPQQPTVPEDEQTTQTSPSGPDLTNEIPRPIPPPPVPDTAPPASTDPTGDPTGGGTGGGGSTTGPSVTILAPTSNGAVRLGSSIEIQYRVRDTEGAVSSIDVVIAQDADGDGEPDGAPVASAGVGVATGDLTSTISSTHVQNLVGNSAANFLVGIRLGVIDADSTTSYALGAVTVDARAPTARWITPLEDQLMSRTQSVAVQVQTEDTSALSVTVLLDPDQNALSGNELMLVPKTSVDAGQNTLSQSVSLATFPAGTYYYYVVVSDGIEPAVAFYGETITQPISSPRLAITNRLVGEFDLNNLENNSNGAIMQGFNFNDLAGSSVERVPDLNGDGRDEVIVGARFGKPRIVNNFGVGWGEAYMIYGSGTRLRGIQRLNSVGRTIPGLIFPGMRTPITAGIAPPNESSRWTKGLSDITVIPDMDGDNLPEIVFSFPRAESINLGNTAATIQHPDLFPDKAGMGALEYEAYYGVPVPTWHPNEAQFTRGGIVIASSHDLMLRDSNALNRKSDRVVDLHEVGQMFNAMGRPSLVPYVRQVLRRDQLAFPRTNLFVVCADCDTLPPAGWDEGTPAGPGGVPEEELGVCGEDGCDVASGGDGNLHDGREQLIERWFVKWDVVFNNQGPGGFHQPWTIPPASPPLANPSVFPFHPMYPFPFGFYPNRWVIPGLPCNLDPGTQGDTLCEVTNEWFVWGPTLPRTTLAGTPSWDIGGNPQQTPNDCYEDNPPGPFLVQPEEPCETPFPPPPNPNCPPPGIDVAASGTNAWTGFYGWDVPFSLSFRAQPAILNQTGETFLTAIGARILGQKVDDEFGTALGADGTWLYISAPERTANDAPYSQDVPALGGPRTDSGIVYQLRTNAPLTPGGITRTQLWIEPGTREIPDPDPNEPPQTVRLSWPWIDAEIPDRADWTMPTPHNYLIESIGSLRGATRYTNVNENTPAWVTLQSERDCPPGFDPLAVGFQPQDMDTEIE